MKESPNLIILSLPSLKSIRHELSPPLSVPENITQWLFEADKIKKRERGSLLAS